MVQYVDLPRCVGDVRATQAIIATTGSPATSTAATQANLSSPSRPKGTPHLSSNATISRTGMMPTTTMAARYSNSNMSESVPISSLTPMQFVPCMDGVRGARSSVRQLKATLDLNGMLNPGEVV
jgi:hypothetical protein